MRHPVIEVLGLRLAVPPTNYLTLISGSLFSEVARPGLYLHPDNQTTVESPSVPRRDKKVRAQVMLTVAHRSPANPLEQRTNSARSSTARRFLHARTHRITTDRAIGGQQTRPQSSAQLTATGTTPLGLPETPNAPSACARPTLR